MESPWLSFDVLISQWDVSNFWRRISRSLFKTLQISQTYLHKLCKTHFDLSVLSENWFSYKLQDFQSLTHHCWGFYILRLTTDPGFFTNLQFPSNYLKFPRNFQRFLWNIVKYLRYLQIHHAFPFSRKFSSCFSQISVWRELGILRAEDLFR